MKFGEISMSEWIAKRVKSCHQPLQAFTPLNNLDLYLCWSGNSGEPHPIAGIYIYITPLGHDNMFAVLVYIMHIYIYIYIYTYIYMHNIFTICTLYRIVYTEHVYTYIYTTCI